ncbi:MAG: hypothetical protein WBE13_07270 [Candidatus Acidiferrum sp.]
MKSPLTAAFLALAAFAALPQAKPATQAQPAAQDDHQQGIVQRGDHVMGFSHDKATHHFRLYSDGGAIEVDSNSAADTATRDEIRMHFGHIIKMFAAGDFSAPMLIHAQNPPGAETMKRLRDTIQFKLENTERGARIRIITRNADALGAVHEFLRFQIKDHQTGDSMEVASAPR